MSTIVTISEGDFNRVRTIISLAVQDCVESEKGSDEEWRKQRIASAAKSVANTLGIKVVNQDPFRN